MKLVGSYLIEHKRNYVVHRIKIDLHTFPLHTTKSIPKLKSMFKVVDLGILDYLFVLNGCVYEEVFLSSKKLKMKECL